jgi:nitrogen regulatory protein P-II 1
MSYNEIKAYIHRSRVADVVHALLSAEFSELSIIDVKGTLDALDDREQSYSVEISEKVITEVKLELVCEDGDRSDLATEIILAQAKTGQENAGSIYITPHVVRIKISS